MHENAELKDHIQHLEHTILQLQSETETIGRIKSVFFPKMNFSILKIGDYIHLYQQQREQLQRRYQEKDDYIKQLTQDRIHLQVLFRFYFEK
jgi:predicted RNase H-like nuclease (RuvC/YqgF family)